MVFAGISVLFHIFKPFPGELPFIRNILEEHINTFARLKIESNVDEMVKDGSLLIDTFLDILMHGRKIIADALENRKDFIATFEKVCFYGNSLSRT